MASLPLVPCGLDGDDWSTTIPDLSAYRYNSMFDGNSEISIPFDNIEFVENLTDSVYCVYYEVKFDEGSLSSIASYVSISDTYKLKITCGYTFGDFNVTYPNLSKYTEQE